MDMIRVRIRRSCIAYIYGSRACSALGNHTVGLRKDLRLWFYLQGGPPPPICIVTDDDGKEHHELLFSDRDLADEFKRKFR